MARWGVFLVGGALLGSAFVPAANSAPVAAERGPTDISARGYRYVSVSQAVAENEQKGKEVACSGDEPVVGGGVFATGAYEQGVMVNSSHPYSDDADLRPDDGWIAYVDNINSGDGVGSSLVVYAICDKRADEKDYRYVVNGPVAAPEGAQAGVAAPCPGDEPVLSGGNVSSGFLNDEMHVNTTQPYDGPDPGDRPDDGWTTFVDNVAVGNPNQVISGFAICDKRRSPSDYVYKSFAETAPDDAQAQTERQCPASARLVGGGMRSSGGFSERMRAVATYPFDTRGGPEPDAWTGAINNFSDGGNFQSITAYAICRK